MGCFWHLLIPILLIAVWFRFQLEINSNSIPTILKSSDCDHVLDS